MPTHFQARALLCPLAPDALPLPHEGLCLPPPLVLLFLVDHILVILWIKETVLIAIVFMDVGLIRVHLSEPEGTRFPFLLPRSYPPNSTNHLWTFL
jgi:hypothetical protein